MGLTWDIFKGLITRSLFTVHALLAIWLLTEVTGEKSYWKLSFTLIILGIETVLTLFVRKGQEYKWICPSLLCFLATVLPSCWLLELQAFEFRTDEIKRNESALFQLREDKKEPQGFQNVINRMITDQRKLEQALDVIEQTAMLIIILGRWLLPKGHLTRDELSQLLLVNIAMAADMIEFFEIISFNDVKRNKKIIILILTLWSWSMLQFPINTTRKLNSTENENPDTPTLPQSSKLNQIVPDTPPPIKTFCSPDASLDIDEISVHRLNSARSVRSEFFPRDDSLSGPKPSRTDSELLGIMTAVLMQDGPYLTLRLFIICYHKIVAYLIIFLTVKNAIVLTLQVYRFCVLYCRCEDHGDYDFSPEEEAKTRFHNVQIAVIDMDEKQAQDIEEKPEVQEQL